MTKAIKTSTTPAAVKAFNFNGSDIRVVMIDGEPAFVGKDVCAHLGYADATNAMKQHCKGVVKRHPLRTEGGIQEVRVLSEPDVLRLIVRSKLPEAVHFERLVFEEILPAIRKTGSYSVAPQIPRTLSEALRLAADQAEQIDALQPKAEAFEKLASLEGCHNLRSSAQQCGWDERLFIQRLIELRWLYKSPVTGRKYAYADKIKAGLMDVKNVEVHRTGYTEGVGQPLITQDGLTRLKLILGVRPGKKATLRPFPQAVGSSL